MPLQDANLRRGGARHSALAVTTVAALLGILSITLAQMTSSPGIGRSMNYSVTQPPSLRYGGSMGTVGQTRLLPSESRYVWSASGMLPSQMRDVRMSQGTLPSQGLVTMPSGAASLRYSSYNAAYSSVAYGARMPATMRYQNPALASASPYRSMSYSSYAGSSRMAQPSMRYGGSMRSPSYRVR